jgi:hypothetical protein
MEIINISEKGLLLEYNEWEKLSEQDQEKYFTDDDFCDSDYLKFKNETIAKFFNVDNKIYYIIVDYDFEILEDSIKEILLKFFLDDFKKYFEELDTYFVSENERQNYEKILNNNITLFYRGGSGYYYGVHKLINKKLINEMGL